MKSSDRQFDWSCSAVKINEYINASSSRPGVLSTINNKEYFVYDSCIENNICKEILAKYEPGTVIGTKDDSILISTGTKPIWITTLNKK